MFKMSCPRVIAGKQIQIQVCGFLDHTLLVTPSPQGQVPGPWHGHWVHQTSCLLPTAPKSSSPPTVSWPVSAG